MNDSDKLTIIYYANAADFVNAEVTASPEREAQIAADPDDIKLRRRLAWIALQHAAKHFAKATCTEPSQIYIADDGRLQTSGAYVSVSHCDVAVAAAISQLPVGIDCEPTSRILPQNIARRIALPQELRALPTSPTNDMLLTLWTAKEAVFKAMPTNKQPPVAWQVDTTTFNIDSLRYANAVVTVATPSRTKIITCMLSPDDTKDDMHVLPVNKPIL